MALALSACAGLLPPPVASGEPVQPLSKVYVENATDVGHHVRMNWPDGFIQVSWIDAGTTQGLEGAIGTSAFPASIDVLTEACVTIASFQGLPRGSTGIVVISPDETELHRLEVADASWGTVGSIEECGATPTD